MGIGIRFRPAQSCGTRPPYENIGRPRERLKMANEVETGVLNQLPHPGRGMHKRTKGQVIEVCLSSATPSGLTIPFAQRIFKYTLEYLI